MDISPHGGLNLDQGYMPVTGKAIDYPTGHVVPSHSHPTAQLIHAVQGVMVVAARGDQWVVPPTRGLWVPAREPHGIRLVGDVKIRTVYIRPGARPTRPTMRPRGATGQAAWASMPRPSSAASPARPA